MMMRITLYWGKEATLLFESWKTDSWLSCSLALLFFFFLSLFHQHLEARRLRPRLKLKNPISYASLSDRSGSSASVLISPKTRWIRVASAVLFGVNSAIGYLIMLAIMSYNGGVFAAVVLGLSIGYILFRSGDFGDADDDVPVAIESNEWSCS